MSAECSVCGFDIVYPVGTWPLGVCQNCEQQAEIALLTASLDSAVSAVVEARNQRDAGGSDADLRDKAEEAVHALLPLVPLTGSWGGGYNVSPTIPNTLRATREEWATAAYAVAELHAALFPPEEQG